MKYIVTIALFFSFVAVNAQRIYYVDTDYILEQMPEYKKAQQTLKSQTERWQKEVVSRQDSLESKIATFENEKILLTQKQIELREKEIAEDKEFLNKTIEGYFGPQGRLIGLRRSLVKPIQDRVATAVQKIAKKQKGGAGFVFDKGSDLILVYTDPKYDLSDRVLDELLGRKRNKNQSNSNNRNNR